MKIALATIIKNEINNISNFLNKNKDVDYICLLDTGSTDGTWEYLQEQARTNPKLMIRKKIYGKFNFSEARNDSWRLIPNDADIIVQLDTDEYFSDENWVEIIKNNITIDNTRKFYTTLYLDGSDYSITGYPRMSITARIVQTKNYIWCHCVHEVLSDDDWNQLGNREEENVWWDKLLIIHEPDPKKDRTSYLDLCLERVDEILPLDYNIEFEKLMSRNLLLFEYYRNDMYEEAIQLYNDYLKENNDVIFDVSPCLYKMTNDIQYIRNAMELLPTHYYEQHLLYYALTYDFEYCQEHYKDAILMKIYEHDMETPEKFRSYDILGNMIKEMANNL